MFSFDQKKMKYDPILYNCVTVPGTVTSIVLLLSKLFA